MTRRPYDAKHVQIVDDGIVVTALWIPDPEDAKDPKALLDAPPTFDNMDKYERVADAVRHYRRDGAGFSGWVVSSGPNFSDPIANKREAMKSLRLAIAEYFAR